MNALSLGSLTADDGSGGDVELSIDSGGMGEAQYCYLSREETVQLRDWLTQFIETQEKQGG